MDNYSQVTDILREAKKSISALLQGPNDEHHRLKLEATLEREINYTNLITKAGDITPREMPNLGPATTIGGKKITAPKKVSAEELEATSAKVNELRSKVEEAWPMFLTEPAKELIRKVDHTVIRGVAKKAHMKVTNDEPEKITIQFITAVKKKVQEVEEAQKDLNDVLAQ